MKNTNKYKNKLRMIFMLLILCLPVATPIALVATRAIPAQAQQQGVTSQVLMQLFMSLLSSLISMAGGGNTPQSGPSEEQVPMMGSINPTRTGQPKYGYSNYPTYSNYSNTNTNNTNSGNTTTTVTVYLYDSNGTLTFSPTTASINSGSIINIQNNTSSNQTIKIKNSSTTAFENQIPANSSVPFYIATAGSYSICASGQIETCGLTLTVN